MYSSVQRRLCVASLALFCLAVIPCTSTVLVFSNILSEEPTRFEDVSAKKGFGPRISEQGFEGRFQLAKPSIYACSAIDSPATGVAASSGALVETTTAVASSTGAVLSDASATQSGVRSTHQPEGDNGLLKEAVSPAEPDPQPVAVLISRSVKDTPEACTFETKVRNAQAAGFSVVIVYDSVQETMFMMGGSTNKQKMPHGEVEIPLVLVSHESGLALTTLITASSDPRGPVVRVDNRDLYVGIFVTVDLTTFMLVTGFLLALLTCGSIMVFTLHRYLRRYEDLVAGIHRPMSLPEVLQLPEVQVEENSRLEDESCPVCLEDYRIGDKLRSLPCLHAFHAGCITPWLTERQRTCPMCKDPVTLGPSTPPPSSMCLGTAFGITPQEGLMENGRLSPSPRLSAPFASTGRGSRREADRLPLLPNMRGQPSDGGSIQEAFPV